MKVLKHTFWVMLALGMVLFGCRPDNVGPTDTNSGQAMEGALDDAHHQLDTICKFADTVFFRSSDGSFTVNKCVAPGGLARPCVTETPWGYFMMYNGYDYGTQDTTHYLNVDFTMAFGFVCDFQNWLFTIGNSIAVDPNTGFPSVGTDWSSEVINPSRSEWKVSIPISELPDPCFDLAVRISAVRLRINGSPNENFRTTLWAINEFWNLPGNPAQSNNEFAIHYCPFACLETCHTVYETKCRNLYTGLTCANTFGSTQLTAVDSGTTAPTYHWSTGATTSSITVSPTFTQAFTVTVTDGGCNVRVTTFNVNVSNVACQVPDHRVDFCPATLDIRPTQSFNIRNYVRMKDATAVNWNNVRFTYTDVGGNLPTVPANWNLAAFNAGQTVTVSTADAAVGTGNVARGEYKIFVYRVGQTTYDDYMTIRVNPNRTSNVATAVCTTGACGYIPGVTICNVPPGNPTGTTTCVSYAELGQYVNGVCGSVNTNTGSYLGACGNVCVGNN